METKLDRLEESVLPLVPKPSRFLAVPGLARAETLETAPTRVCLVHPGPWEAGVASPAIQSLIAAFAGSGAAIDLCVVPDAEVESIFRRAGIPAFGLGARKGLGDYDLLVLLPDRMLQVPAVLRALASAGVSAYAAERGESEPLVVLAGGLAFFPEPLVPFLDAVLLGDPEAFVADLVHALTADAGPGSRRQAARFRFTGVDGVYAPGVADPPADPVRARWLDAMPVPVPPFISPVAETLAGGVVLEVARESAERRGELRLLRAPEETVALAEQMVAATGCGEIQLTGSATRHPGILPMLEDLDRRLSAHGVHLRVDAVDYRRLEPALARELRKGHGFELVFEPVALSPRLREAMGEPLSDPDILEAVETARRGGWGAFRFRAWTGLPGETPEDLESWARVLEELAVLRNRGPHSPRFFVELLPWIPERADGPGRPPGLDVAGCQEAAESLRRRLRRHKIRVIEGPARAAALEGLLRAAGREAAPFFLAAAEAGAVGPDLGGGFEPAPWEAAAGTAPLPEAPAGAEEAPPWGHLDPRGGRNAPSPGTAASSGAGDAPAFGVPPWMGGRRPKRASRGRETRQSERFRLRFCKDEPLRFSSHLDVTRAFLRAMRRSQLPVAVSNGKDRRPRISFGPPLPVGMTSGAEYLDVTFHREVPETFVNVLNQTLTEGLVVVSCAPIRTEPASLNSAIQIAAYEVSFSDTLIEHGLGGIPFEDLRIRLQDRVSAVMSARTLSVTRVRGEESRTYNARPSLKRIQAVRDDGGRPALSMMLTLNQPDSVRPELLTATLVNWADFDERLLRVHRSGLHIPGRNKDLDPLEVVAPGFKWWRQPVRGGTVL